ncbi:MAG: 30S ribosomal protein S18 [Planctomycetes bacterium]|nr:30S ribosomal protein S18 [Planctomycetota bacterium]
MYYNRQDSRQNKSLKIKHRIRCRMCRNKTNEVDYKDTITLQKFCNPQSKILSRKRSGNCIGHQRMVQNAIKLARFMALMPYVK